MNRCDSLTSVPCGFFEVEDPCVQEETRATLCETGEKVDEMKREMTYSNIEIIGEVIIRNSSKSP